MNEKTRNIIIYAVVVLALIAVGYSAWKSFGGERLPPPNQVLPGGDAMKKSNQMGKDGAGFE